MRYRRYASQQEIDALQDKARVVAEQAALAFFEAVKAIDEVADEIFAITNYHMQDMPANLAANQDQMANAIEVALDDGFFEMVHPLREALAAMKRARSFSREAQAYDKEAFQLEKRGR